MSGNTVKEIKKEKKESPVIKILFEVLDGTFLTREKVMSLLPFMYFMTFIAVIYIANTYYSEKVFKEIRKIENELKELKSEHISITSELMFVSKQSKVANRVEQLGLKESVVPPKKIVVTEKELENINNSSNSGK